MDSAVFIILGATGGIGSALTRRLAARGARLVLGARSEERLRALADDVGWDAFPLDATRFEDVERCIAFAVDRHGKLDGIANCVGNLILKPAHMTSEAEWSSTVACNLTSAFATVRAAAKPLSIDGGSIVLLATAAARIGLANHEAIAAAKAGVMGLVISAAATYAPKGVRVNCVAPGLVRTPMTERLTGSEASLKASVGLHPLGRIGEPSDVVSALEWLLDPAQSWVTGQVIGVDGGLGTVRSRT